MGNKFKNTIDFGVIGLGRFGYALASTLANSGREVLVLDRDPDKVKTIGQLVEQAFVAEKLDKPTLIEAGINNCRVVIICVAEQIDVSILTTLNVIELGVERVLAKAVSPEHGNVLKKIGAEVVYPEKDMAERLATSLMYSDVLERIDIANEYAIEEVKVPPCLWNKTIEETNIRKKFGLNIIAAIKPDHTNVELTPDTLLGKGDVIVVIGKHSSLSRFEEVCFPEKER